MVLGSGWVERPGQLDRAAILYAERYFSVALSVARILIEGFRFQLALSRSLSAFLFDTCPAGQRMQIHQGRPVACLLHEVTNQLNDLEVRVIGIKD